MPKDATKLDIYTTQDLSEAVLSYTTSTNRKFQLTEVIIHFSEAVTETVTLTRDSKNGANYDVVLNETDLVAKQDYVFRPVGDCIFEVGDELKVYGTNANVTGVAYVTIKRKEVN